MNHIEKVILSKASGEHRFDPKQQQEFLGTFRERVILAIKKTDLTPEFLTELPSLLHDFKRQYAPLSLKISAELGISLQMSLMKIAEQQQITSTVVDDNSNSSSYVCILHSDRALNLDNIEPAPLCQKPETTKEKTKSFWARLFHK